MFKNLPLVDKFVSSSDEVPFDSSHDEVLRGCDLFKEVIAICKDGISSFDTLKDLMQANESVFSAEEVQDIIKYIEPVYTKLRSLTYDVKESYVNVYPKKEVQVEEVTSSSDSFHVISPTASGLTDTFDLACNYLRQAKKYIVGVRFLCMHQHFIVIRRELTSIVDSTRQLMFQLLERLTSDN